MKTTYFIAALLFSTAVFSQNKPILPTLPNGSFYSTTPDGKAVLVGNNLLGSIYLLPQDRMICLVPDLSGIAPLPNARITDTISVINKVPLVPYKILSDNPLQLPRKLFIPEKMRKNKKF